MLVRVVLVAIAVHSGYASICPQINHTVCNADHPYHACVCAIVRNEHPAPDKSCNSLLKIERNRFPATSVTFAMDERAQDYDLFPEHKFRSVLATSLRVDEDDIVLLRLGCIEQNQKLTVQFVVLRDTTPKRNKIKVHGGYEDEFGMHSDYDSYEDEYGDDGEPLRKKARKNSTPKIYATSDVIRAMEVVNRIKAIAHFSQLTGITVDKIQLVHEMIDIEGSSSNTLLAVETILAGVAFAMMCMLGVWRSLTHKEEHPYETIQQKV